LSEVPGQAARIPRIALFADVQNLYYTVRQAHGCHFDYSALWAQVSREGEIVEAKAYAIERGDSKQQQFQQILRNLGFEVRLKPFIQRSDGSAKGDWDVGITLDVVDAAPHVDRIVLASGDGDFDQLLQRVAERHGRDGGLRRPRPDRQCADPRCGPLRTDRRPPAAAALGVYGRRATSRHVTYNAWALRPA